MPREIVDVFRHEAGHMVVAKLLGFQTQTVVYRAPHAGSELTIEPILPDIEAVTAFIRKRLVILLAGALAETLNGGRINNDRANELFDGEECADDRTKVRELSRILAGIERGNRDGQTVLNEVVNRAWNRAVVLVERYSGQISLIARTWRQAMGGNQEITITAAEIAAIPEFAELPVGGEVAGT